MAGLFGMAVAAMTAGTANAADGFSFGVGSYGPRHGSVHEDLDHRTYHRDLEHREAHRYPMTWQGHERLHDGLNHSAYHDRVDHSRWHGYNDYRVYRPYYGGCRPYNGGGLYIGSGRSNFYLGW
jgi:hypothetical protein